MYLSMPVGEYICVLAARACVGVSFLCLYAFVFVSIICISVRAAAIT